MKILRHTLSLEELEQEQSNAPDQSTSSDAPAAPESSEVDELSSTGEAEEGAVADEAQSEALEAQFLVLEDLYNSLAQTGKLTGKTLVQANEALPGGAITHGHYSAEQRYSLVMEGILSKAGELVKKMWQALVELWRKFAQHIMNPLDKLFGRNLDLLGITPAQASKMTGFIQAANERVEVLRRQFPTLEDLIFEDRFLKSTYAKAGGVGFAEAMKEVTQVIDRAPQVVVLAERYLAQVRQWMGHIGHGDPQPIPQDFEKGVEVFAQAAKAFSKVYGKTFHAHSENPIITPQAIVTIVHATPLNVEHGLPRRFFLAGTEGGKLVAEAGKKIDSAIDAGQPEQIKQWRELHKEMQVVLGTFRQVLMVFTDMAALQKEAVGLGDLYLRTIGRAYSKLAKSATTPAEKASLQVEEALIEKLVKSYNEARP